MAIGFGSQERRDVYGLNVVGKLEKSAGTILQGMTAHRHTEALEIGIPSYDTTRVVQETDIDGKLKLAHDGFRTSGQERPRKELSLNLANIDRYIEAKKAQIKNEELVMEDIHREMAKLSPQERANPERQQRLKDVESAYTVISIRNDRILAGLEATRAQLAKRSSRDTLVVEPSTIYPEKAEIPALPKTKLEKRNALFQRIGLLLGLGAAGVGGTGAAAYAFSPEFRLDVSRAVHEIKPGEDYSAEDYEAAIQKILPGWTLNELNGGNGGGQFSVHPVDQGVPLGTQEANATSTPTEKSDKDEGGRSTSTAENTATSVATFTAVPATETSVPSATFTKTVAPTATLKPTERPTETSTSTATNTATYTATFTPTNVPPTETSMPSATYTKTTVETIPTNTAPVEETKVAENQPAGVIDFSNPETLKQIKEVKYLNVRPEDMAMVQANVNALFKGVQPSNYINFGGQPLPDQFRGNCDFSKVSQECVAVRKVGMAFEGNDGLGGVPIKADIVYFFFPPKDPSTQPGYVIGFEGAFPSVQKIARGFRYVINDAADIKNSPLLDAVKGTTDITGDGENDLTGLQTRDIIQNIPINAQVLLGIYSNTPNSGGKQDIWRDLYQYVNGDGALKPESAYKAHNILAELNLTNTAIGISAQDISQ